MCVVISLKDRILTDREPRFFPNIPVGYKVVEIANPSIYSPLSFTNIESIRVWLTDQDGDPINLRNEVLSMWLHIREV